MDLLNKLYPYFQLRKSMDVQEMSAVIMIRVVIYIIKALMFLPEIN